MHVLVSGSPGIWGHISLFTALSAPQSWQEQSPQLSDVGAEEAPSMRIPWLHQEMEGTSPSATAVHHVAYQVGKDEKDYLCEIRGPQRSYNSRLSHDDAGGKVGRGLSVKSDSLDNCFTGQLATLITTSQLLVA